MKNSHSLLLLLTTVFVFTGITFSTNDSTLPSSSPTFGLGLGLGFGLPIVATPHVTPNETEHISSVTARISCSTMGAVIYYSIDGSEPRKKNTGSPIVIDSIGTINLILLTSLSLLSSWSSSSSSSLSSSSVSLLALLPSAMMISSLLFLL
jgi:hypothetical protein